MKQLLALLIVFASISIPISSQAYFVWNRHYHSCWNGVCHSASYHRYCQWGRCWTHWSAHNWMR